MIKDYFLYGLRNLRYRKMRSWLTVLGVVVGIAAIVALISLGQGLENAVQEQFEKMGINSIRIVPKGFRGPGGDVEGLTSDDAKIVEKIPGVDYAEEILMMQGEVEYGNEEQLILVVGSPISQSEKVVADLDLDFESGRRYTESEEGSVMIGHKVAHDLFDKEIKLRSNLYIEGKKFKVVGIFEKTGIDNPDNIIFMSLDKARDLFNEPETVSVIRVQILKGENIDNIGRIIEKKLERAKGDESFTVFTPEQMLEQIGSILDIIRFILAGIAAISLAVGGIGIMNAMYTSVKERTRDIGVMKAIGATNGEIMGLFITEAGLIGLVGGVAGAIIGNLLAYSVELVADQFGFGLISIQIEFKLIFFALLFSFMVGVLSGLLPAMRAAKQVPVEALRYE